MLKERMKGMAKVAIFLATGFEEIEALTVVDLLRRVHIEVDMVSITGEKKAVGSHGIVVETDKIINQLNFTEYDMLVLPGGMPGTLNLEACEVLMNQVDAFYEQKKYLAAICAAPSILGHKRILGNLPLEGENKVGRQLQWSVRRVKGSFCCLQDWKVQVPTQR